MNNIPALIQITGTKSLSELIILMIHIESQVKIRQSYKFKKFAEDSNFGILQKALHATHLWKLLDEMYKYEMDPVSIVEDTQGTRFCPQMDGQTDRRTDGTDRLTTWNQYTPFQNRWSTGYNEFQWLDNNDRVPTMAPVNTPYWMTEFTTLQETYSWVPL